MRQLRVYKAPATGLWYVYCFPCGSWWGCESFEQAWEFVDVHLQIEQLKLEQQRVVNRLQASKCG